MACEPMIIATVRVEGCAHRKIDSAVRFGVSQFAVLQHCSPFFFPVLISQGLTESQARNSVFHVMHIPKQSRTVHRTITVIPAVPETLQRAQKFRRDNIQIGGWRRTSQRRAAIVAAWEGAHVNT